MGYVTGCPAQPLPLTLQFVGRYETGDPRRDGGLAAATPCPVSR